MSRQNFFRFSRLQFSFLNSNYQHDVRSKENDAVNDYCFFCVYGRDCDANGRGYMIFALNFDYILKSVS